MTQLYRTAKKVINHWNEFGPEADFEEVMNDLEKVTLIAGLAPTVVCLCGSTRFKDEFVKANLQETLAGKIVVTIGCDTRTDDEIFGHLSEDELNQVKAKLDELHLRKIDFADEVLILNKDGYIGQSTSRELAYAQSLSKTVRFLEEQ